MQDNAYSHATHKTKGYLQHLGLWWIEGDN